jgi:hypothetical protein
MGTFVETAHIDDFYHSTTKENKLPFPVFCLQKTNGSGAVSVFHLQQTKGGCRFPLVLFSVYIGGHR